MKKILFSLFSFLIAASALQPASTSVSAETPFLVKQHSNKSKAVSSTVQPRVELLNAGAEPRQELRFKPPINTNQTATMTMNMDMAMSMAGQTLPKVNLPTTVFTINTVVTKVDPNGDIHYQFSYSDVNIMADPSVPSKLFDTLQRQIKTMVGTSGSVTVDNRGQTKVGKFVLPKGLDQNIKPMMEQMSDSLNQLSSPLPKEAIGIGAKWRVTSSPTFKEMKITQVATYELVNLKNGVATLNVKVQQQAQPQTLNKAGLPAGSTLAIKSFNSQGQGQVVGSVNRLLPIRSNLTMHTNSQVSVRQAGKAEETTMNTKLLMKLNIKSK